MKFNPRLRQELGKYFDYVIIVEGKKDIVGLRGIGFERVYAIHQTGLSLRESIEKIVEEINLRKDRVCILTDFDRRGKLLYMKVKGMLQELGVRLDSSLRGILLKARVSHVEGLYSFMEKVEKIGRCY